MADELSTTLPCLYLGAVTGNLPSGLPVDNFLDWLFSTPQEMLIVVDTRQYPRFYFLGFHSSTNLNTFMQKHEHMLLTWNKMPLVLNYAKANLIIKDNLYVQWNPLYHTHLPKSASVEIVQQSWLQFNVQRLILFNVRRLEAKIKICKHNSRMLYFLYIIQSCSREC